MLVPTGIFRIPGNLLNIRGIFAGHQLFSQAILVSDKLKINLSNYNKLSELLIMVTIPNNNITW